MRFEGRVCLITGASSGIGAATARAFAVEGATLVLTGRDERRGGEVLAACRARGSGDVIFVPGDIADVGDVVRVVSMAVDKHGRIDVLFNNAGIIDAGTVVTTSPDRFRRVLDVNLFGQFLFAHAVVPIMQRQGRGAIVNNASDRGLVAGPDSVAYSCSKAGVVMLTKSVAVDHGADGIRCNAVCPGDTLTPMVLQARAGFDGATASEFVEAAGETVPLRRMAQPEEIAAVVLFLASDEASFMTGSIVPVDGGNTSQ